MTYAVTGSTGALGSLAIRQLLNLKVPAASIIALARDAGKAAGLKALGVQVRLADYNDRASLEKALQGVDRLLLVSSNDMGHRFDQHKAVIDAAKANGVKLLAYTSVVQATVSTNPVAPDHKATEAYLQKSGLPFVLLRNNWYTENYAMDLKYAKDSGLVAAAVKTGRVASASRADYAEAAARVLVGQGHEGKTYELTGAEAWDYPELARVIGELHGRPVRFQTLSPADRQKGLAAAGLPEGFAQFYTLVDQSIEAGSLAAVSPDLGRLLGRAPLSLKEALKAVLG